MTSDRLHMAFDERPSTSVFVLAYLRLGFTAFGGPAAHISMMHREFVEHRKWLSDGEFADLLGAVHLIPGPNSTQLAMAIGKVIAGRTGLVLAGLCFIAPAALIVATLASLYVRFGSTLIAQSALYGIKPVVVAIVAHAIWRLGPVVVKGWAHGTLGLTGVAASVVGTPPLAVVFLSGLLASLVRWARSKRRESWLPLIRIVGGILALALAATFLGAREAARVPYALAPLFLFFLKVGSVLYGSGYVLLAFLNNDLVLRWNWLTKSQLLDAVAVGQFTPGPVFTTATFIGYLLGGPTGALLATLGIFLPSFLLVGVLMPWIPSARASSVASAFLDGVNVASLALMAVVAVELAQGSLIDALTWCVALVSFATLARFRVNASWLILGGGLAGALFQHFSR